MLDWRVLPSDVSSLDASRVNATPSQEAPSMPATQGCRDCGSEFPYDADADICPACVKINTVTPITLQVHADHGPDQDFDLEGNDAVEWRAELRNVVADPDVRRVLVLEGGHVIHDWSRVNGVA